MAESSLSNSIADIRIRMARYIGRAEHGSTAYSSLSTDMKAEIDAYIKDGLAQFYFQSTLAGERKIHEWSFLKKSVQFTTNAQSAPTDTVTVALGVGTMMAGTLASWIEGGVAQFNLGGPYYNIATRNTDTEFTLEDTSLAVTGGSSVVFYDHIQSLGDDFGNMDGPLTYAAGSGWLPLEEVSEGRLRTLMSVGGARTDRPTHYAIRPRTWPTSGTSSTRWEIMLWPFPNGAYSFEGIKTIIPGNYADTDVPIGGARHSQAILASCLAIAEQYAVTERSEYRSRLWPEAMQSSILMDRNNGSTNLGYNADHSTVGGGRWTRRPGVATPTYNGVAYPG